MKLNKWYHGELMTLIFFSIASRLMGRHCLNNIISHYDGILVTMIFS